MYFAPEEPKHTVEPVVYCKPHVYHFILYFIYILYFSNNHAKFAQFFLLSFIPIISNFLFGLAEKHLKPNYAIALCIIPLNWFCFITTLGTLVF